MPCPPPPDSKPPVIPPRSVLFPQGTSAFKAGSGSVRSTSLLLKDQLLHCPWSMPCSGLAYMRTGVPASTEACVLSTYFLFFFHIKTTKTRGSEQNECSLKKCDPKKKVWKGGNSMKQTRSEKREKKLAFRRLCAEPIGLSILQKKEKISQKKKGASSPLIPTLPVEKKADPVFEVAGKLLRKDSFCLENVVWVRRDLFPLSQFHFFF